MTMLRNGLLLVIWGLRKLPCQKDMPLGILENITKSLDSCCSPGEISRELPNKTCLADFSFEASCLIHIAT